MTSPAEKLFDEIDSLQVKLRGLREQRNDLLEQTCRLDFEIGRVRLEMQAKLDAFNKLNESVAESVPARMADPQAHISPVSPAGSFSQGLIDGLLALPHGGTL